MATGLKELALPEGACRIFEEVLPLVLEFVPAEQVLLGGGTALAARWQHRESFDIDLFMPHATFAETIFRESARFEDRLKELRLGRVATFGTDGCTLYSQDGKVDIVASFPLTANNRSKDCAADGSVVLETNLEILAKKLHHRMIAHGRIVPRDLYDMAFARRFEPEIMEAAWSARPVRDPQVLVAALTSFSPGWMRRHEEPVVNPRCCALRDNAVQDMVDDVSKRFQRTVKPWGR